jgi:hypothetical protein
LQGQQQQLRHGIINRCESDGHLQHTRSICKDNSSFTGKDFGSFCPDDLTLKGIDKIIHNKSIYYSTSDAASPAFELYYT